MKHVHIEGMGITGCLLALRLSRFGVPFTWHDADAPRTAWKASTGAIYPAGKEWSTDWWTSAVWRDWHRTDEDFCHVAWLEEANYWFNHQKPPHEGCYQMAERSKHGLARAVPKSLHLNAQAMVPAVRAILSLQQTSGPPSCPHRRLVAHGWSPRQQYVYWGWTRLVHLKFSSAYARSSFRPAFYFRDGRYIMAYAYPRPDTSWWYAGSSIIKQKSPGHPLEMKAKYERWEENFKRLSGGAVWVDRKGEFIEGWRPSRGKEDKTWTVVDPDDTILVPPLWNSGIRHFPKVWGGVAAALGIEDPTLAPFAAFIHDKDL